MPFSNRVRLPLQLHSPQFPEERNVFRKANGQSKTLSVIIRKVYEMETDLIPEKWHQRLKILLAHDNIIIEGEKYLGSIVQEGDYNIEWPEGVLHYPAGKAGVKVQVTPFDATNANCATCDVMTQLSLENDNVTGIYGALQEDQDYSASLADNDNICCYPAVFSLVSFNDEYLTSASVDPATGILSIHTGTDLVSANSLVIATYRVTCPDGSYDEADITADIEGSIEGCLAPSLFGANGTSQTEATITWTVPEPGGTYVWEVYEGSLPVGSPVQSGTTTGDEVFLTGLTVDTLYYVQVRRDCGGGNFSNYISGMFDTLPATPGDVSCGNYSISYSAPPDQYPFYYQGYADCNGITQVIPIPNGSTRYACALENSPGDPYLLASSNPYVTITYIAPC